MKNRQFEHTGWFHPSKSFETDMKNWSVEYTGWFLCSSCLVQNFWMETPCMFSLSTSYLVEKLHEVLTNWTYRKIPSESFQPEKLNIHGDSIQVLNQTWKTDKLNIQGVQNFWMETPCIFSLSTSYLVKKCWIESSCMLNLSVLHVWPKVLNQTWSTDKLNIQGGSI
jgi:hypothetical protein